MAWNNHEDKLYLDERSVNEEIRHARFIFEKGGFSVLNVTNKPIESTANEILSLMAKRFPYGGRKLESPYQDQQE